MSGIKFMGKDPSGNAKAIKTDKDGRILQRGESEIIAWTKDNPTPNRNASDFEIRDTNHKYYLFPHLRDPYAANIYTNIFDQNFIVSSRLNAEIEVSLTIIEIGSGALVSGDIATYILGTIPAYTSLVRTMVITPEKSSIAANSGIIVVEFPELRQGYPAFRINVKAKTVPTSGDLRILNTRRY